MPATNPTLDHQSSTDALPVFLPGSTGRWLHEEAALNGSMPVLIGGDGRRGPYVSPVVHIPIDVRDIATVAYIHRCPYQLGFVYQ